MKVVPQDKYDVLDNKVQRFQQRLKVCIIIKQTKLLIDFKIREHRFSPVCCRSVVCHRRYKIYRFRATAHVRRRQETQIYRGKYYKEMCL